MKEITEETQDILNKINRDFNLTLRSGWVLKQRNPELLEFCLRLSMVIEILHFDLSRKQLEETLNSYMEMVEENLEQFKLFPDTLQAYYKGQVNDIKKLMEGAFKK